MDAKLLRERKENSIGKLCFIDSLCFLHQHARRYHFKYFLINVPEYMQLALTHFFIDGLKYFKYFLLIRSNISNIFYWSGQIFQIFLDQHARRCSLLWPTFLLIGSNIRPRLKNDGYRIAARCNWLPTEHLQRQNYQASKLRINFIINSSLIIL